MRALQGTDMLHIDVANCMGMDKKEWIDRLLWTQYNIDNLESFTDQAEDKLLYQKAVKALRDTQQGIPTGHIMFLDATASGYQIMAAMTGCLKTAENTNLVFNGKRNDLYLKMSATMTGILPTDADPIDRDKIKKPTMTTAYNSKKQPEEVFGKDTAELHAFHRTLHEEVPGAMLMMDRINAVWNPEATEHTWTLPDKHVARVLVTDIKTAHIEIDELDHVRFSHRFEAVGPSDYGTSLVANVTHSIDGYVVRRMIEMAKAQGFELAHIFDAFCCHPNHMPKAMQNYRIILADIARSNLLADILTEISGTKQTFMKLSNNLAELIMKSEYTLS